MSKTQDFLDEYMEKYISSLQGPGEIIKTQISSPANTGRLFNSLSEFKTQEAPNAFEDFLVLQKNPEALTQNIVMQNSPGFINTMSMFGG